MTRYKVTVALSLSLIALSNSHAAAQATSTASRRLQPSAFVMLADTYTGLGGSELNLGGRNFSLTAGFDLGVYDLRHYGIAAEVRGTYPLLSGHVDGQKSILGGIRVERRFGEGKLERFRPYGDVLGGRGEIEYVDGGFQTPTFIYLRSPSNVYGLGGGFEFNLTDRWAIKADAQFQHWDTPVTHTGNIYAKQGGGGIVYRFGAGAGPR